MKKLRKNETCGMCGKPATGLVFGRGDCEVIAVCVKCSDKISDKGNPEYIVGCPNCDCEFGVN